MHGGTAPETDDLERQAVAARSRGDFAQAASLYARAAESAAGVQQQLWLTMRRAYCHVSLDELKAAEALAHDVADRARVEMAFAELADALGLLVDQAMAGGRYAEGSKLLSEAMYVMERVPNEPPNYLVVHNMAVTFARCDFPLPALELYDRALRLAPDDLDRTFTYANMAAAYHLASYHEADAVAAERRVRDGIYAATAALDPQADSEVLAQVIARAHRSMLLGAVGHHAEALQDALVARREAEQLGLDEERVVAMVGEALARWRLHHDPAALDILRDALEAGRGLHVDTYLRAAVPVAVEQLWAEGRFEDARTVLEMQSASFARALRRERDARWEHVRLGVSLRTTEAISESDPLTGLPNRRYLGHWLPEVLDQEVPVAVAVLDLDGFKQVNDEHSYAHGDRVLQELSGILQRICRRGDAVVRLGGDEFVLVLRDTSAGDARTVLERVRQMIAVRRWEGLPATVTLTASVGVAVGSGAVDAPRVLAAATEAMQAAKRDGRDRIVFR